MVISAIACFALVNDGSRHIMRRLKAFTKSERVADAPNLDKRSLKKGAVPLALLQILPSWNSLGHRLSAKFLGPKSEGDL